MNIDIWSLLMRVMMRSVTVVFAMMVCLASHCGEVAQSFGSQKLLKLMWPNRLLTSSFGNELLPVKANPNTYIPVYSHMTALPTLDDAWRGNLRSVNITFGKYVALTFDYCELCTNVTGYQPEVIKYLRHCNVPATLFMSGKWMQSHEDIAMQLIADPLFEIGNHAWSHANLALTPIDVLDQQVLATQAEYIRIRNQLSQKAIRVGLENEMNLIPTHMTLFRLPYGRCNNASLKRLHQLGFKVIQWSHVGFEGHIATDAECVKFADSINSGSIILLHGNNVPKHTSAFVKRIVPILKKRGFVFVTVSELIKKGKQTLVNEGYFLKPGDNLNLDSQFGIMGTGLKK